MSCKLFLVLVLAIFATANGTSVGYRFARTFYALKELPWNVSAAMDGGWTSVDDSCNPYIGISYQLKSGVDSNHPLQLQYSSGGQIAGFKLFLFGSVPQNLQNLGYWVEEASGVFSITVSFRNQSIMCSGDVDYDNLIGDQLIVNQGKANFVIPLTTTEATQQMWRPGGCITGMGQHWAYDTAAAPNMTWEKENLFPIQPMYESGVITAILVNAASVQNVYPLGIWEGPFINSLFCYNWCSNDPCTWDAWFWTTVHFMFTDKAANKCTGHECDGV